jgi:Domain of unknown function (DUF4439)
VSERPSGTELAALQTALAAEHAAIYGYGVVGAHLAGGDRTAAGAAYRGHRRRRDELTATIRAARAEPEPAAAAYTLPFEIDSASDARRLATRIEDGIAQAYAALVAASAQRGLRELGAAALGEAAVAVARWSRDTTAFPGLSTPSPSPRAS